MNQGEDRTDRVPGTFKEFVSRFPALGEAHEHIARAAESAGPLDRKTQELIKIGLSIGAGLESAARSHIRRALNEGASEAEIEQSILLTYNTCGWPQMVMAWRWMRDQLAQNHTDSQERRASSGD